MDLESQFARFVKSATCLEGGGDGNGGKGEGGGDGEGGSELGGGLGGGLQFIGNIAQHLTFKIYYVRPHSW